MREIKFKVFYSEFGMSEPVRVSDHTITWRWAGGDVKHVNSTDYVLDGWIYLQFTGLFNANGVEIYEGDLLALQGSTQRFLYVVKYEDAKFVLYHLGNSLGKWGDLSRLFDADLSDMDFQLIGNIYQDSHLLEQPELVK